MYLRLVHLKVKPGRRRELREFYESRVMGALAQMPGCVHVALLEGRDRTEGWLSATFWKSYEQAEDYEESGLPAQLIEESEGILVHERQWKVELSQDMKVDYQSAMRALEVEGYSIEDAGGRVDPRQGPQAFTYVRIVSLKIDPEKVEEFKRRWDKVVVPVLREVRGCRFAFLSEAIQDRHHMLSVSIWDNQQSALKYELSGKFHELTRRLQDTLAPDFKWKKALAPSVGSQASGPEPETRGYEVVAGGRVG
jgi:heme-degrading monooxygenase HmoA